MIHRAPFGSLERFLAILIEHFAGAFPLWLAPEQVRVLPISDKVADYAQTVLGKLLGAGLRASLDQRPEKINAKIRDAQLEKIPVMLVVGAKEAENEAVAYRDRTAGDLGAMPLAQAIARINEEVEARTMPQVVAGPFPGRRRKTGKNSTRTETAGNAQSVTRPGLLGGVGGVLGRVGTAHRFPGNTPRRTTSVRTGLSG